MQPDHVEAVAGFLWVGGDFAFGEALEGFFEVVGGIAGADGAHVAAGFGGGAFRVLEREPGETARVGLADPDDAAAAFAGGNAGVGVVGRGRAEDVGDVIPAG